MTTTITIILEGMVKRSLNTYDEINTAGVLQEAAKEFGYNPTIQQCEDVINLYF